jgi:hypothetical protein
LLHTKPSKYFYFTRNGLNSCTATNNIKKFQGLPPHLHTGGGRREEGRAVKGKVMSRERVGKGRVCPQ